MKTEFLSHRDFSSAGRASTVKIQSLWRGYRIRKNFIFKKSYNLAKQFIAQNPEMIDVPKANSGMTKVFLPQNLPVILKALGVERSKKRFFTMWKARDLCIKSGYKHLLIPKACPYKEYNIEDRLPVHDVLQREQVALYEENSKKFTQVAKEFTGFLCQSFFPDILTETHCYRQKDEIPLVRCDNLPMLIDKDGKGKMALIDLGGYYVRTTRLTLEEALERAKTAIFIFPYHLAEILEVMQIFCPEIRSEISYLQELCHRTLRHFKSVYADHREFIAAKMDSNLQPFCQNDEDVMKKTQLLIEEAYKIFSSEEKIFLCHKKIALFRVNILEPILKVLVENHNKPTLDYNQRAKTFNCEFLHEAFPREVDFDRAKSFLLLLLQKLIDRNEICYVNIFYNRFNKLNLRIHY